VADFTYRDCGQFVILAPVSYRASALALSAYAPNTAQVLGSGKHSAPVLTHEEALTSRALLAAEGYAITTVRTYPSETTRLPEEWLCDRCENAAMFEEDLCLKCHEQACEDQSIKQ
jgi:hypothetical protein